MCSVYAWLWDEVLRGRDGKRNREQRCLRMIWVIGGVSEDGGMVVKWTYKSKVYIIIKYL